MNRKTIKLELVYTIYGILIINGKTFGRNGKR